MITTQKRGKKLVEKPREETLCLESTNESRMKWIQKIADSDQRLNISLTNDFAFKKIFRNKKALTGLLCALLDLNAKDVRELEFPDTYLHGEYTEEREGILDVKIHLNNHEKINIEMQVRPYLFWEARSLFYLSKMFVEDFSKGCDFSELETCIHISILGFDLVEGEEFYSIIELRDRENQRLYSDKMSLRVLYLNKLEQAKECERETDIYKWAKMISAKDWEVLTAMAENDEYRKEALDEMEKINSDRALRYQYLREAMWESDKTTVRNSLLKQGKAEGKAEGKVEGELYKLISQIRKKQKKGLSAELIANALEEDIELIAPILSAIQNHPDEDDEEILRRML
ncbi:MAG: Rpn family recombination-promoting nuclease/putative transposase [Hungatella sp.]